MKMVVVGPIQKVFAKILALFEKACLQKSGSTFMAESSGDSSHGTVCAVQ
jgi:hypothetical protein